MINDDWSTATMRTKLEEVLREDPLDEQKRLEASRQEQAKAARIADAMPGRFREIENRLKAVPDAVIDERIAQRRKAEGLEGNGQPRLPAQIAKDRIEEKFLYAKENLEAVFDNQTMQREFSWKSSAAEWERYVNRLNLDTREKIRFKGEAEGKQYTTAELNDKEARAFMTAGNDGIHGPSQREIENQIDSLKARGNWPPPDFHTGPDSRPRPSKAGLQFGSQHRDSVEGRSDLHGSRERGNVLPDRFGADMVVASDGIARIPSRGDGRMRAWFKAILKPFSRALLGREGAKPGHSPSQATLIDNRRRDTSFQDIGRKSSSPVRVTRRSIAASISEDGDRRIAALDAYHPGRETNAIAHSIERFPEKQLDNSRPLILLNKQSLRNNATQALRHAEVADLSSRTTLATLEGDRQEIANPDSIPAKYWRIPKDVSQTNRPAVSQLQNGRAQTMTRDGNAGMVDAAPPRYGESQKAYGRSEFGQMPTPANRQETPMATSERSQLSTASEARRALVADRLASGSSRSL